MTLDKAVVTGEFESMSKMRNTRTTAKLRTCREANR
jgi:hypothetical protein